MEGILRKCHDDSSVDHQSVDNLPYWGLSTPVMACIVKDFALTIATKLNVIL
jgi:hypothetical protein